MDFISFKLLIFIWMTKKLLFFVNFEYIKLFLKETLKFKNVYSIS